MNAYEVCCWGSNPNLGNDDCWSGLDFPAEEEARDAFDHPERHFSESTLRSTVWLVLEGPDVSTRREIPGAAARVRAYREAADREWRRELAMEAGMCLGVAAYNDMMDWGGDDEDG